MSWVQKKVGQAQVTENPFVTQVVDAARRILARPPERRKPLTADQVMRIISRSEAAPYPVAVLEKILKLGSHSKGSKLFRRIQSTKRGQMLKEAPLWYFCASALVKKELKSEGLDPSLYSLHSLRSGGASSAAALEIPDRLFQRQGGWRSTQAKNNYIQESLDSLLLVTRKIQGSG